MSRVLNIILSLTALALIASQMAFALRPRSGMLSFAKLGAMDASEGVGLATIYLRPQHPAMWIMAAVLWISLGLIALKPPHRNAGAPVSDVLLLTGALLAAAVWPWLALGQPLAGFLMAVMMLLGSITISREGADGRLARDPLIGIIAGWATVVTFAAFASFLTGRMGILTELSSLVSLLLLCSVAVAVQLRMSGNPAYTVTIMFALLATAATLLDQSPLLAVIAVLGLSALTFLLVRVTT